MVRQSLHHGLGVTVKNVCAPGFTEEYYRMLYPIKEDGVRFIRLESRLSQLDGVFYESMRGRGRVVVISGAAGCGKTQLLHNFETRIRRSGSTILRGSGYRTEVGFPWGVVRQLFLSGEFGKAGHSVNELINGEVLTPAVLDGLAEMLFVKMKSQPLVIFVDDLQYADELSRGFLLYLIRRSCSAPLMMVLAWKKDLLSKSNLPTHQMIYKELYPLSYCVHMEMGVLSREEIYDLIRERFDEIFADQIVDELHNVSGGNPLLVLALIEDYQTAWFSSFDGPGDFAVGDTFTRSILTLLYRSEPGIFDVASALAVLGEPAPPELLSRMSGIAPDQVVAAVKVMGQLGLLDSGWFRHPAVETAVLDGMTSEDRADAHRRAAVLLRGEGADPIVVARQLVSSGRTDDSWALTKLLEAANYALLEGDIVVAVAFLRTVYQSSSDRQRRETILAKLACAEWRIKSNVNQYLPELTDAVLDGTLSGKDAAMTITFLMLQGRVSEARRAIARLAESGGEFGLENAKAADMLRKRISLLYPSVRTEIGKERKSNELAASFSVESQLSDLLLGVILGSRDEEAVARAEQVLKQHRLSEGSLSLLVTSLMLLIYADHLELADRYCSNFLEMMAENETLTWRALLSAVAAEISLRQGLFVKAKAQALAALSHMPAPDWGVLVGFPIGTLVLAQISLEKYDEASESLAVHVPDTMYETPFGLHYLHARGRYNLAIGLLHAALDDYRTSEARLAAWGAEFSPIIPWRTEVANTLLQLGERSRAAYYLQEELFRLGQGPSRGRGRSLRLLAATRAPEDRPSQLRESVEILQCCGDRSELVCALNDLREAYRSLGQKMEARSAARQINLIIGELQSEQGDALSSSSTLNQDGVDSDLPPGVKKRGRRLSKAERRVAALAAQGRTNREIAGTLYLTTSTVEQHLTRIYRKLGVHHRAEMIAYFAVDGPAELGESGSSVAERRWA